MKMKATEIHSDANPVFLFVCFVFWQGVANSGKNPPSSVQGRAKEKEKKPPTNSATESVGQVRSHFQGIGLYICSKSNRNKTTNIKLRSR